MKLILVKSFWGMTGSWEEKFRQITDAGYAAVEGQPPTPPDEAELFKKLLRDYRLDFIAMVITEGSSYEDHFALFRTKIEHTRSFSPLKITVHGGKDWWPFEQQRSLFAESLEIERRIGIEVNHETHRGRPMFTPAATARLLREYPELHINADFSHFVNVCESLLEDQTEAMDLCISRARHVHGRIGHEEGPQVNDPRAPEWSRQVAAHEAWWDEIVRSRLKAGSEHFTFNPEFGPPNYMPTLPHTCQPVADLWEICLWMARRFERRYRELVT
jgi:sugar phosphate isomerase/epimerase